MFSVGWFDQNSYSVGVAMEIEDASRCSLRLTTWKVEKANAILAVRDRLGRTGQDDDVDSNTLVLHVD